MAAFFVLDVVLVLAFAYWLTTVLRPPSQPAFLVALFVLVWADLVFSTEILSLLVLVTARAMLVAHALQALLAFFVWRAAGKPAPPKFVVPSRPALARSLKSRPELWILGLTVGLAYALLAVINMLVPPNNMDSMVYHLSRVAFWIQHQTLAPWPTPNLTQTIYPPNAEIGSLWSMLFLRRDILAGFVQWFSSLAAMVSVFGLSRTFGFSRPQAAFASSIYLTLPMIVLQSTTTQNDLALAAMITTMAYLLLLGLKTGHRGMLVLSGAAMGLALGMKLPAVMVLPGFGLGLAVVTLTRKPRPFRRLFLWAGACLAGFVMLGAFNYVQNWIYYRHLLGGPDTIQYQANESKPGDWTLIRSNVARDVYSLMDLTGLPHPIADSAAEVRARLGRAVFSALRLPSDRRELNAERHRFNFKSPLPIASEAGSFFGPLGFFLWFPLVLYWCLAGLIKRDARLIPALAFVGFMLAIGGTQAWQPFRGRFYCAVITLSAPLVAGVFRPGRFFVYLRGLIVGLALTVLTVTVLTNVQKPLTGPRAIWDKTRYERRTALWGQTPALYRAMDRAIPAKATVAVILKNRDPEYPMFGEKLGRTIIQAYPPPGVVSRAWLQQNDFRYMVVHDEGFRPVETLPASEFQVISCPPYKIIIRK